MKLGARNQIKGTTKTLTERYSVAYGKVDVCSNAVTAAIANEAAGSSSSQRKADDLRRHDRRLIGVVRLAALMLAGVCATAARADCDHFKWSVAKEMAAFSGSPAAMAATGGSLELGTAYALELARDVKLAIDPERKPTAESYAAIVTAPKLEAGLYQITLSEEAWIDVVQNGTVIKSSDFSGQRDCPGLRKTVRFKLLAVPATIQISNATVPKLNIEISEAK